MLSLSHASFIIIHPTDGEDKAGFDKYFEVAQIARKNIYMYS
jgi:hypothetical protein